MPDGFDDKYYRKKPRIQGPKCFWTSSEWKIYGRWKIQYPNRDPKDFQKLTTWPAV
jgi:hypothetical protein